MKQRTKMIRIYTQPELEQIMFTIHVRLKHRGIKKTTCVGAAERRK